ncbi:MAG: ABC transporter substrate-binding protein [Dehalococcoidia bacterium]
MDEQNYWQRRIRRRTVLQGAVTVGSGIAFAAACSSGSKNGNAPNSTASPGTAQPSATKAASSGVLAERVDTTSQALPGTVLQSFTTADATNLDPIASPSFTANVVAGWVYPRLFQFKPGYKVIGSGEVQPELAESLEQPDPTTLIIHLKKNAVWDERPPTNKRPLDSSDVLFSWNKYAAQSINRNDLAHSANPNAPVLSVEAPDQSTVVFKLGFPYSPMLAALAYPRYLFIMPKESDGGFDPRNEIRGAGAWNQTTYQRSVKFEYRKNPNWFMKDKPFLDGFDFPIVPEYASELSQFRAKRIWVMSPHAEDVIQTKKDLPELQVDQNGFGTGVNFLHFGLQPGSPFLDPRVRRAASMLIDRDTWIDTFFNISNFKNAGYPIESAWNSHLTPAYPNFWLDPKGKDLGAGAANFGFNQGDAKKLLSAAGFPNGVETDIVFISTGQYGTIWPKYCDVFKGMLEDGGNFRLKVVNPDYQTEYLPKYHFSKADYKGIVVGAMNAYPDVDSYLYYYYHSSGPANMVALQGKNGDPKSESLIEAQRKELDANKRAEIVKEWQRYVATTMPLVPFPGQANTFTMYWPWVRNWGVFRAFAGLEGTPQESYPHLWFDKSKYTG